MRKRKLVTFQRRSSREGAHWACLSADKLSLPRRNEAYQREERVRCGCGGRLRDQGHREMGQSEAVFSETGGKTDGGRE